MIASNSAFIFSGNQPNSFGKIPAWSSLDFAGSYISSSEPETWYPFWCKAKAKLCITAPPTAIKCTLFVELIMFYNKKPNVCQ